MNILLKMTEIVISASLSGPKFDHFEKNLQPLRPKILEMSYLEQLKCPIEVR